MNRSGSTVELGTLAAGLLLPAVLVTALALAFVWVARPWELKGGSVRDKLRVGDALNAYDFWLALRGVGGRRRRALRDELRANLWEATRTVGARQALRAVGPMRALAREGTPDQEGTPWGRALAVGLVGVGVVLVVELLALTIVLDTADAAGVNRVDVPVTLVPGMHAGYESLADGGFTIGADIGPAPLVVGLVAFVVAARPWRLLRRRVPTVAD